MLEKIFGKKDSIQRRLVIEFIIVVISVTILSSLGAYIFIHREATEIIKIQIKDQNELKELLKIIRREAIIILLNTIIASSIIIKIASKKLLDPLEKMIEATKKVADGDFNVKLETKRKDEIEDLVINFNQMVNQLGKTETLQKDFIDNVSHEIKTPISSIQGFAKLLDDDELNEEERKEYIGIIIEESNRLLNLSTNILKLSKLQNQENITKREQIDLAEQIRKSIAILEPKWREKNLGISVDLKNIYFYGDEELLFQVWINLIDNSIKFSKKDGKIEIKLEQEDNQINIKIKDYGIGMSPEELDKIYTRFYQVDKSHSVEGSGLRFIYSKKNYRIIWR